jgi:hypothetical protein
VSTPLVRVVHSIPGRTRLRAQDIKGNVAALDALRTGLEETPGVQTVAVTVLTGSVLVEHDVEIDDVLGQAERSGVLRVDTEVREHYLATLNRALNVTEERVKDASNGKLDLETIAFVGFVAGGIYQMFNNHGLPAGVTMLRYAVELVTAKAVDKATQVAVERVRAAKLPGSGTPNA